MHQRCLSDISYELLGLRNRSQISFTNESVDAATNSIIAEAIGEKTFEQLSNTRALKIALTFWLRSSDAIVYAFFISAAYSPSAVLVSYVGYPLVCTAKIRQIF